MRRVAHRDLAELLPKRRATGARPEAASSEEDISLTIGQTDELTDTGVVRGKGTTFQVLRQVTLRVHTKGVMEARLDVIASGKPLVMSMGGKVRDLESYEVRNGALFAP